MKISFQKKWDKEGCCYSQGIAITQKQFDLLQDNIMSEIYLFYPRSKEYNNGDDLNARLYLKPLELINGKIAFMKNTQKKFVEIYLSKNTSRKILDRNTYLLIK